VLGWEAKYGSEKKVICLATSGDAIEIRSKQDNQIIETMYSYSHTCSSACGVTVHCDNNAFLHNNSGQHTELEYTQLETQFVCILTKEGSAIGIF
jgi:hypothetical protein